MAIYVVSLAKDEARRERLRARFPLWAPKFVFVDAVDGRVLAASEYFHHVIVEQLRSRRLMSPAELGCALSHMEVLRRFLASDERCALVLEDDVLGDDSALACINRLTCRLEDGAIVICGGQEGLRSQPSLMGKKVASGMYKLARSSRPYVQRTCCYLITRKAAATVLEEQITGLGLADDWARFCKNSNANFYFQNLLHHPDDLSESHIESERRWYKGVPLQRRLLSRQVFRMVGRRMSIMGNVALAYLQGYRRILL